MFGDRNIVGLGRSRMDRRVSVHIFLSTRMAGCSPQLQQGGGILEFLFCLCLLDCRQSKMERRKTCRNPSSAVEIKLWGFASFGDSSREMRCLGGPLLENTTLLGSWIEANESRFVGLNRSAFVVVSSWERGPSRAEEN